MKSDTLSPSKSKKKGESHRPPSSAKLQLPTSSGLEREQLLRAYSQMFRARRVDERIIVLYKQNKCFFQIGCAGHEAIGVAAADALQPGSDWAYPYYRDMAFCAALGMSNRDFLLNALNKAADPNSGGRHMPMHYGHKDLRIVSQSSPTGTQFLQAVGTAHAIRQQKKREVVYVSAGEGTCAQGEYHEALNWAAREKLPVIFVIQDNQYAISVHVSDQHAGSVEDISSGYRGLNVVSVDGTNYVASYQAMRHAVERAQREGPTVVVAKVVRLQSHSISDNQAKYRTPSAIASDKEHDPLALFRSYLLQNNLSSETQLATLETEIEEQIRQDSTWAEAQPDPEPHTWSDHILSTPGVLATGVLATPSPLQGASEPPTAKQGGKELFLVEALNAALREEMAREENIVVYGQDVAFGKGGVFSVTEKLTDQFTAARCFNSPLAEASIVGTAIGMAVAGLKPVVEIQFGDYIWTAMMQLRNELAMLSYRSNGAWTCPVVVRTAVGGYIRGGLYHSQNIESIFAHSPGLIVLYPSNAKDGKGLLKSAIRCADPVLFLEHKGLYRQVYAKRLCGGEDELVPIGKASIVRPGDAATIVSWGALVQKSLLAAEKLSKEGVEVEVLDLRSISPLDLPLILDSVRRTGRLLVAHEDQCFAGFGGEVVALVSELAFEYLDAPPQRLAGKFAPVPHAPILEDVVLPQTEDVIEALRRLLAY